MKRHGEADGSQQPDVLPGRHSQQRLVLRHTENNKRTRTERLHFIFKCDYKRRFYSPVEGIAHLDSDQHGQGHGHGVRRLEDLTVDAFVLRVLRSTLEEVALRADIGWNECEEAGW